MALGLDKIDSAPILGINLPFEFLQWIWVLIDSLNENISDLEANVSSFTALALPSPPGVLNQTVDLNTVYVTTNPSQTIFQLPTQVDVGKRVQIDGWGAGGWKLLVGSGQTIQVPMGAPNTASASITSSSRYDSISIICVVANTTWIVVSQSTTGFVIV